MASRTLVVGITRDTGIERIFSMVGATIGAHTTARAPSRSARTAAMMASSTVDTGYSLTFTVSPSMSMDLGRFSRTVVNAITPMKWESSGSMRTLRLFITWRTVRRFGSRLSSRILYMVLWEMPESWQNSFRDMLSSSSRMLRKAFWNPPSSLSIPFIRSDTVISLPSRMRPRWFPPRSPGRRPWPPATACR